MNVDQSKPSVLTTDEKNASLGASLPLQSTSANSAVAIRGSSQEQPPTVLSETNVNGSSAANINPAPQKKESGQPKAQADKKKIDARKKSLKRL